MSSRGIELDEGPMVRTVVNNPYGELVRVRHERGLYDEQQHPASRS